MPIYGVREFEQFLSPLLGFQTSVKLPNEPCCLSNDPHEMSPLSKTTVEEYQSR